MVGAAKETIHENKREAIYFWPEFLRLEPGYE
jgi:hypothetical protein